MCDSESLAAWGLEVQYRPPRARHDSITWYAMYILTRLPLCGESTLRCHRVLSDESAGEMLQRTTGSPQ